MKQVLQCGYLFSTTEKKFVENQNVYLCDDIIEKVESGPLQPGYDIIDLKNKYVLPGLIDCHLHTNLSGGAADMNNFGKLSVGDFTILSVKNAQADLLAGFTTIRDQGAMGFTDVAVKKAVQAGKIWGPRVYASGYTITATGGHGDTHFPTYVDCHDQIGLVCDSPNACREGVRYNFKHGTDQIKVMCSGGVMSEGDDVGAPEFTLEELQAICSTASSRGRITSAHAHAGDGIKLAVQAGITSIEHGTLADQEAHDMMLEKGTYLVATLSAGYNILKYGEEHGIPSFMVEKVKLVVDSHFKTFRRAYEMGIPIAFGTDCGTPFTIHGKQAEEFRLMVDSGCSTRDAIMMATQYAAELLRIEKETGSIQAGKQGDIIAVDQNPLDDITELERVTFVMKAGTIYKS